MTDVPSPARRYRDKVWESTRLTPIQRLVALCYAEHAYGSDTAWVAQRRLMDRTGIRSFSTATSVVGSLVEAGWLDQVGPQARHRQRVVYRLTVPDETVERPTSGQARDAHGRYAKHGTAPVSGADEPSMPDDEPLQSVEQNRSSHGEQPLHQRWPNRSTNGGKPLHQRKQTAPVAGDESVLSPDDSLQESGRDGASAADAATLRAARLAGTDEELDGPAMDADTARALARAIAGRVPPANVSHWKVGTAPVGEPNPLYDPLAAAALAHFEPEPERTSQEW